MHNPYQGSVCSQAHSLCESFPLQEELNLPIDNALVHHLLHNKLFRLLLDLLFSFHALLLLTHVRLRNNRGGLHLEMNYQEFNNSPKRKHIASYLQRRQGLTFSFVRLQKVQTVETNRLGLVTYLVYANHLNYLKHTTVVPRLILIDGLLKKYSLA